MLTREQADKIEGMSVKTNILPSTGSGQLLLYFVRDIYLAVSLRVTRDQDLVISSVDPSDQFVGVVIHVKYEGKDLNDVTETLTIASGINLRIPLSHIHIQTEGITFTLKVPDNLIVKS